MNNPRKGKYAKLLWFNSKNEYEDLLMAVQNKDREFTFEVIREAVK